MFHTNFSVTAPEVLIASEMSGWVSCVIGILLTTVAGYGDTPRLMFTSESKWGLLLYVQVRVPDGDYVQLYFRPSYGQSWRERADSVHDPGESQHQPIESLYY